MVILVDPALGEHFVEEQPESPDVVGVGMVAIVLVGLRGHVGRRAHIGVEPVVAGADDFGAPEVDDAD